MSWEAWGTPPDPEPQEEPDPGWKVPEIGARQQWCCANGCGACSVRTTAYVWREVYDKDENLIEQNTTPIDVSACCGADLMLWDEDKRDFIEWTPVTRETPNVGVNAATTAAPTPRGENQV